MLNITPCLWFDGKAEAAAEFYTGIFTNSRIDAVHRAPADFPSGKKGDVLTVEFTLDGRPFVGLNGGPHFTFDEAISFQIYTADQTETDRYWDALVAGGGTPSVCGWLKDKFGLSWQVVPRALTEKLASQDRAAAGRAMEAMLQMRKIDIAAVEAAYAGRGTDATTKQDPAGAHNA